MRPCARNNKPDSERSFMKNTYPSRRAELLALGVAALILAGCGKSEQPQTSSYQVEAKQAPAGKPASHEEGKEDGHEHGEADRLTLGAEEIRAAGIKVESLAEQEISEQVTVTATIRPNQDRIAHVAPRVPGRIVRADVNLGDAVKAGQTLAVLDSLEVGEAHSSYLQAQTAHALARADFERAEKLQSEQIIAQKDYLRARAESEKAKAALAEDRVLLDHRARERRGQREGGDGLGVGSRRRVHAQHAQPVSGGGERGLGLLGLGAGT